MLVIFFHSKRVFEMVLAAFTDFKYNTHRKQICISMLFYKSFSNKISPFYGWILFKGHYILILPNYKEKIAY